MAERSAASEFAAIGGERADDAEGLVGHADIGSRLLAYLVDSLVMFVFTMVFAIVAGLIVFVSSNYGSGNPSDGAFLALVIVLLATMPSWYVLTFALLKSRGQTIGHYLFGLHVLREDGAAPTTGQVGAYLAALHPLVFHPGFAGLWGLLAYESVVIVTSSVMLYFSLTMVFLCLVAPIATLVFVAVDRHRRGVHDRLAGLRLVGLEDDE